MKWIGVGLVTIFAITIAMVVRSGKIQSPDSDFPLNDIDPLKAKKLTPDWTDDDFRYLDSIAKSLRMNSADLLLILTSESGLKPYAVYRRSSDNFPVAVGLNQLTSAANETVGITEDERVDLLNKSVSEQLPIVKRFFEGLPWTKKGKSYDHAALIYEANFAPGRMISRGTNLDTILFDESDGVFYTQNKSLDTKGKGNITVGDLVNYMRKVSKSDTYKAGLYRLRESTEKNSLAPLLPIV